jgi:hypothetical protein
LHSRKRITVEINMSEVDITTRYSADWFVATRNENFVPQFRNVYVQELNFGHHTQVESSCSHLEGLFYLVTSGTGALLLSVS